MALVVAIALAYLAWVMADNWDQTRAALAKVNPWMAALALAPCIVMYLAKAWYHALIVRQLDPSMGAALPVMAAYCQAQIVRYLPGKLWGILYQAGRLQHHVSPQSVLVANAVQTLNTQLFALGYCATVLLAAWLDDLRWLWLLPAGAALMLGLHRIALLERLGLALLGRITRRPLPAPAPPPPSLSAQVVALLSFDWLVFVAAWLLLVDGHVTPWGVVVLTACYGIASLLATFAVVVPAGLVLREALFVTLGQPFAFGAEDLLTLGVVARLVFTVAEIACLPLLGGWARLRIARAS